VMEMGIKVLSRKNRTAESTHNQPLISHDVFMCQTENHRINHSDFEKIMR